MANSCELYSWLKQHLRSSPDSKNLAAYQTKNTRNWVYFKINLKSAAAMTDCAYKAKLAEVPIHRDFGEQSQGDPASVGTKPVSINWF